eukprot:7127134-Prymnesium_polylepis.1
MAALSGVGGTGPSREDVWSEMDARSLWVAGDLVVPWKAIREAKRPEPSNTGVLRLCYKALDAQDKAPAVASDGIDYSRQLRHHQETLKAATSATIEVVSVSRVDAAYA